MDTKKCKLIIHFLNIYISLTYSLRNTEPTCFAEDNKTWRCNYIPEEIPSNFSRIRIMDIVTNVNETTCDNSSFSTQNNSVVYIEFVDQKGHINFEKKCFNYLKLLKEIHIHSLSNFTLPEDIFTGLLDVEVLDFSRCSRLSLDSLRNAFHGKDTLQNLMFLKLSSTGDYTKAYDIDKKFVDCLPRNLTKLELSMMQLSWVNFTEIILRLKDLQSFNASYSTINDFSGDGITAHTLEGLNVLDLSYVIFPKSTLRIPGHIIIRDTIFQVDTKTQNVDKILAANTVNGSGVLNTPLSSVWIYNCKLSFDNIPKLTTRNLVLRHNGIKRLDVDVKCDEDKLSSLRKFDLSDNGLAYIHPTIFSCMKNIENIELSHNDLFQMAGKNLTMVKKLFARSRNLRHIDLSENSLNFLPYLIFENNYQLEVINLSKNKFEQVNLMLKTLDNLRVLDLSNNRIKILNEGSLSALNSIPGINSGNISRTGQIEVSLSFNPISCSSCDSSRFVKWITESRLVVKGTKNLNCLNEENVNEPVTFSTLNRVQRICHRRAIIVATSVSLGVIITVTVVSIKLKMRHKKQVAGTRKRAQLIAKLQEGFGKFEFLAMLSYSNEDEEFGTDNIKIPLNDTLKELIGVDRNLILTGDENFRPGFMVHNEISESLEKVSAVLMLITENFCTSSYCLRELDQAYIHEKPIILMFKEEVDEARMTPIMRTLYKDNARVLWKFENGAYKLKTSWENICNSIIELILEIH